MARRAAGKTSCMEIRQSFDVDVPPAEVWAFLQDVPSVVPCMPGAELLEAGPDSYRGRLRLKLGAIAAEFEGTATVVERDDHELRARVDASGADRRGGNRASASISYRLHGTELGTKVELVAEYRLQGPMAQMGRGGLIQDISAKLTREFAECLRQRLASPPTDAPPDAAP